jgi:hypothetical protein
MTQLARTSSPGIYRAHGSKCNGTGRCDCPYVIMWRHRGRQHKETSRSFNEAREKKSLRDSVDSKRSSGPTETIRLVHRAEHSASETCGAVEPLGRPDRDPTCRSARQRASRRP